MDSGAPHRVFTNFFNTGLIMFKISAFRNGPVSALLRSRQIGRVSAILASGGFGTNNASKSGLPQAVASDGPVKKSRAFVMDHPASRKVSMYAPSLRFFLTRLSRAANRLRMDCKPPRCFLGFQQKIFSGLALPTVAKSSFSNFGLFLRSFSIIKSLYCPYNNMGLT